MILFSLSFEKKLHEQYFLPFNRLNVVLQKLKTLADVSINMAHLTELIFEMLQNIMEKISKTSAC